MQFNDNDYIDISLARNRSNIAIIIASILSLEELEYFITIEDDIAINNKRDLSIPAENIIYFTINGKIIKLLDIVSIDKYPTIRFIDFRILIGNAMQLDFKIKYNKNIRYYINSLIIEAINFGKYKNKYDKKISKANIINNFSKLLANNVSIESLKEFAYVSEYIDYDEGELRIKKEFFNFSIDNIIFDVKSNHDIIKFGFITDDKEQYIYLPKDKIGTSTVCNIIEKAIKIKSR